jgi:IMP cyclohydrolase
MDGQVGSTKDFGGAIAALKAGRKVSRSGWNSKGMFLYLVGADAYPAKTEIAKKEWGENALVPYQSYVAMKTVQGTVVPWSCSQTDMLAEDWEIV